MTRAKNPFAELEKLRASLPSGPAGGDGGKPGAPAGSSPAPKPGPPPPKAPARAVVRMERKGRGGKEVTVIDKLDLRPAELERWCRELKQALGCGGSVDGDLIVLQGDLRPRIGAVLEAKGVARVTIG
ncbi:MAG TPA: translation initiation factor [Kofleriaceae bacterium]|nr:translation initiation factor [Kofleriaceae bacterium]